jgi:hypothetical protein
VHAHPPPPTTTTTTTTSPPPTPPTTPPTAAHIVEVARARPPEVPLGGVRARVAGAYVPCVCGGRGGVCVCGCVGGVYI